MKREEEKRTGGDRLSVVIPTLNAEKEITELIRRIRRQTLLPEEILILDSCSADGTREAAGRFDGVRILTETRFNHGGTRDRGFRETRGDVVLFLTQDAMPASEETFEKLCGDLRAHPKAAAAYGRQMPRADARPAERWVRDFSYPAVSETHDLSTMAEKGLRAFYLSNAFAAYRREAYEALGGFEQDVRSNEDMLFAAKAIRGGYEIVYSAEACVVHSHNLTLAEQYARNRLQGYELARHRALLENDSPVASGKMMLAHVSRGLLKEGRIFSWIRFGADCAARLAGNRAGAREYDRDMRKKGHG